MLEVNIGSASLSLSLPDWMTTTSDSWLSDHQVLVGGVLGFAGVCISVLSSAILQSRARKAERKHKSEALRIALISELEHYVGVKKIQVERLKENMPISSVPGLIYSGSNIKVLPAVVDNLGLLSTSECKSVMTAYEAVDMSNNIIASFSVFNEHNNMFELNTKQASILIEALPPVLMTIENQIARLKKGQ